LNVAFKYLGRSHVEAAGARQTLSLAPNLLRDAVAFDAPLRRPLRFREAMSTLHDVVISDLKFRKKDKTAYQEWKKGEPERFEAARRAEYQSAAAAVLAKHKETLPADFEATHARLLKRYWGARQQYANYLLHHDYQLWRKLMPCDPVITVADDVVFFECFSADESSYGCLSVNRDDCFGACGGARLGTTNVDYSWDLYHHFQSLRTYRETRFQIDPAGFSVATHGAAELREEKIDLPNGWLRGFMQLQSAMALPATRVSLSREAVYSMLVWLKRHRARTSPRAMRFELLPDAPPRVVLEPWEVPIVSHGTRHAGPNVEPIRVWGARRLLVLARLLPLIERVDVYLLGTGLPSFWVAQMGEMRLTLGLSGWTANDWTRASALELIARPAVAMPDLIARVGNMVQHRKSVAFDEMARVVPDTPAAIAAALRHLAYAGQVIHDLDAGVYRWREIMPQAIGEAQMGPENAELVAARQLLERDRFGLTAQEPGPAGGWLLAGTLGGTEVELLMDADGRIKRGKCPCEHYRRYGLKNGPCRHMLALRWSRAAVQKS